MSLTVWLVLGLFTAYRIHRTNRKTSIISQISTKPPVDRYNRIYFAITKENSWTESNDMNLYSYDGLLANTTDKDFKDWCIKLKIPETTIIANTWNCYAYIEYDYLYIKS